MSNLFPRLHNPHNRRLNFKLSISFHGLVCLDLFLWGLFELDLVDFETVEGGCEEGVEGECVGDVNFFAFGGFCEDAGFATGEGLECSFDFFVLYNSQLGCGKGGPKAVAFLMKV